jgi:hypothetical protein
VKSVDYKIQGLSKKTSILRTLTIKKRPAAFELYIETDHCCPVIPLSRA